MGKRKKGKGPSPWDNMILTDWRTSPSEVRLLSDKDVKINWPFGDDVANMMSSLDDEYFAVYLKKIWKLIQAEAKSRPVQERDQFLREQRARLDRYRAERRRDRIS